MTVCLSSLKVLQEKFCKVQFIIVIVYDLLESLINKFPKRRCSNWVLMYRGMKITPFRYPKPNLRLLRERLLSLGGRAVDGEGEEGSELQSPIDL